MSMSREDAQRSAPADGADAVHAFYDSHPYPPPITDLSPRRDRYRDPHRRRAQSLLLWPLEKLRSKRKILVAGCGTSQAAKYALAEPDAMSRRSTSVKPVCAIRAVFKKNMAFAISLSIGLAIESVGELGETFDQIVCTGVLHHLADPDAGLRSLRDVLAVEGAMHVMVYGAYGRAGVTMMQDYCRLLGIGPDAGELRDLAAIIGALSSDHPIAGVKKRAKDFGEPDALADALLNPQERAYTVPEIHDWLQRCGLESAAGMSRRPISHSAE